jgi:hypothetical protein
MKKYKISHVINGTVKKIYVFSGKQKNSAEALNKLFLKKPTDAVFADIFTPEELTDIRENAIQVRFISEYIHLDDTIETIKKKLLSIDLNVSFAEMYCFIIQPAQFQAASVYQNLTQNDKLELTKERLVQFLLNINEYDVATLPEKDVYTYDDIFALNLEQSIFSVIKPLGQKIGSLKDDYPYTVNPYSAEFYDPFLEKFADEIITTTNKNILLDYGSFLDNTIYLTLAEEVLTFGQEYTFTELSTLKIYYPYLYEKNITTLEQLQERKQELLGETKAMLTPLFEKNIENVNLFYDIYHERKEELNFKDVGIKSLIIAVQQPSEIHLPLDNVFKLIHATQDVPLIKMNLSKRQEKIYRLYADKIATNGKKIPYLDKGAIFKWDKVMGKEKSVSVYIEHYEEETGAMVPILCEFLTNGTIIIKAEFNTSLTPDAINELFIKEVNPVINVVKDYLAQDGYTLNNFIALKEHDILNLEFAMNIEIKKDIKLKKIVGCLTSMFNVINDDLAHGIMLRFKRVSNYNEMESQEALILDMSEPHLGYSDNDIIKVLQTNFQLSEKAAAEKYAEVKRAQELMQEGNRRLKKRNNPGFLTTIVKQPFNNIVMINVSGINNIGYLTLVQIYLDTLMRITQKQSSTKVSNAMIEGVCAGKKTAEEKHVEEIIAHIDQPNVYMTIEAEELVFNKPTEIVEEEEEIDEDDLMARFGYADDADNIIVEEGGAKKINIKKKEQTKGAVPLQPQGAVPLQPREEDLQEITDSLQEGVEGESPLLETDITGQSLGNPSPFERRMRKYDKNLFVTDTGKKNFSSYATDCQMNRRRQPIVLTDQEKAKIDKEHPGSYSEAIKYGSDPSKQFWYICPRYWDMKNNTSLNEAEVDKSLVIPKDLPGKKVPPGKHIFEFNDYGPEHLSNQKYITHSPGFLKAPHEERGACLPCCFKKWGGPIQTNLRSQCMKDTTIIVPPGRKKKKAVEEINEYILAPDKFPITQENRFGYLPIAVQKFLHTDNKKCQISEMNANLLKQNHECLLRHSVEINPQQSFIGCIADIWFETYPTIHKEKVRPTIKRMKEIFIETLTVDHFVTLQNGNLIKLFYPKSDELADMDKYADTFSKSNSKIYQLADKSKPEQMNALIKIARAYANFVAYLKDDTVEMDYEYLWDLICKPNPKLFPMGINMVIIELTRKDITDNVELICPSNHYSASFFDTKKSAILLLKIDNFYEPIYAYKTNADEITINRTFNIMYKDVMPNIKYVLEMVKNSLQTKCAVKPSMPIKYNTIHQFEKNIPLEKLIEKLKYYNYGIESQVMNYDSKIIGVVAINNQDNNKGFIPCYPSAPLIAQSPIVFIEDAFTDTYENTKDFLEKVYTKTKRQIVSKPLLKVVEDGLIVGLITMTNQFVPIDEPTQDTFGEDLKIMQNIDYTTVDTEISNNQGVDIERVNYIKKIQLETKFYNVFRTTARYLLGQYQNNDIRREIEEKNKSTQTTYLKKLRSIETLLRDLMGTHIQFHQYAEEDLLKLDTITNCYNNCEQKGYCKPADDTAGADGCSLLIPAINLINEKPNDTFYYGKLADEIIRYSRIKTFIFNPKSVLSFSQLKYNLRENEIILLQSLLTQEYFENIIAAKVNPYIKYNTYDTTQPIIAQNYPNTDTFDKLPEKEKCDVQMKEHISSKYWQAIFPLTSKEYVYPNICFFEAILVIIQDSVENQRDLTKNVMKEVLLNEYMKLYDKYEGKLLQILSAQGKKLLAGQISKKQISLADMIMSEEYYATDLDIWLLAIYYHIPLVFLSETALMENNKKFMVANAVDENQAYYFLKVSAILPQLPPVYTIFREKEQMQIAVGSIRLADMQTALRVARGNTLIPFIESFSLTEFNMRNKTIKKAPATVVPPTVVPPTVVPPTVVPPTVVPAPAPVKKIRQKINIR